MNTKAVPRFEYTPYGMVEVADGWYVNVSDHEAAISELRSNHERVVGELNKARDAERLHWVKFMDMAKTEIAASRAEVERQAKVIESYRNQKKILDTAMEKGNAS